MNANVGSADRIVRIVIGLGLLGAGVALHSFWGLVGLLPVATGLFRFCPAYSLLGISTCKR